MIPVPPPVRLSVLLALATLGALLLHETLGFTFQHTASLVVGAAAAAITISMFSLFRNRHQTDLAAIAPALLTSTLDTLTDGVLLLDHRGCIIIANQAFADIVGIDSEALRGVSVSELGWKPAAGHDCDPPWRIPLRDGSQPEGCRMTRSGEADSDRIYSVKCAPVKDRRRNGGSVVVSFSDISLHEEKSDEFEGMLGMLKKSRDEIRRQNEALEHLATRDPLTGCMNRRSFFDQYETKFQTAQRKGKRLACVIADIDLFKQINDRYGHTRGDKVIRQVAETLRLSLRSSDAICRYGGEEFCIILQGITLSRAEALAERARTIIEKLRIVGATDASAITITASFGVACSDQSTQTLVQLIDHAEKALSRAKSNGRNRVFAWHPEPETNAPTVQGKFLPGVSVDAVVASHGQTVAGSGIQLPVNPDTLPGHDSLTGLPNRKQFHGCIVEAVQACRVSKQHISVIMLDLDMFRRINNTLGYEAGDQLLKITSERLCSTLRSTDSVLRMDAEPQIPSIYSLGGDEFGILLTGMDHSVFTVQVLNRIIEAVTGKVNLQGKEICLTCSVGASVFPENGTDADTLLNNACTALYFAKLQGHNSYQLYDPSLQRNKSGIRDIAADLSHAVSQNAMDLYYLPKIDLRTGHVNAVEALVRWHHSSMGMIPPDEFLPVAEETGLMPRLGYWVIDTACRHLRQWHNAGHENITASVNLSVAQFHHRDLLETVLHTLEANGLQPGQLELEITERTIMENIDAASSIIRHLHNAGIRISVDDFGTGYSSLNQLKRFPINTVKIDRSFIRDLTCDEDDAAIVSAIISAAHKMGMQVIAEGVETEEQLALLCDMQCDAIQGFLFSPPVPHDEALELLDQSLEPLQYVGKPDTVAV